METVLLTEEQVLSAMDQNGAKMKLREIEAHVDSAGGNYTRTQMILRRLERAGKVEYIGGRRAGWRLVGKEGR